MELDLDRIRLFDVLHNSLNGELALVMSVSGALLDLRDKTGTIVRYKFGAHFSRAAEKDASEFRAHLLALRKKQVETSGKKRRRRTVSSVINRFAKKR